LIIRHLKIKLIVSFNKMPAGEMIGNGGLMPMPTMGSPIPGGSPRMGMPPGAGMIPLPQMGAITNGMPPAPFGSPSVNSSVFNPGTDSSDFERQLRERAIQERNKQLIREQELERQGQLNQPMVYAQPNLDNFGVNLDVQADDDGVASIGATGKFNDGAQQIGGGVTYLPGYTMDGIGRVPGAARAEINYGTKNFNFTGGYTSGRRGMRGGFGGTAGFRGQF
jgi:hypothetical protein